MATGDIKTSAASRPGVHPRWVVIIGTLVAQIAFGVLYAWATASF